MGGLSGTIELASGLPAIDDSLIITGPGAETLRVDANGHSRVLTLAGPGNTSFQISGLTLSGGVSGPNGGGGIHLAPEQALILDGVSIVDNVAADGPQLEDGGGLNLSIDTNVTLRRCLIARNHASRGGGVFAFGGEISVEQSAAVANRARLEGAGLWIGQADASVTETTITGNVADSTDAPLGFGGGVFVFNGATLTVYQATVFGNLADVGPGLWLLGTGAVSDIGGSIVALSRFNGSGDEGNCSTTLGIVDHHNLSGDASCGFTGAADFENTDPDLQGLAWAGGPTPSLVPMAGSPVVDQGSPVFCFSEDQRGWLRPVDGDADGGADCDLGSVELDPSAETVIFARGFEWSAPLDRWSDVVGN